MVARAQRNPVAGGHAPDVRQGVLAIAAAEHIVDGLLQATAHPCGQEAVGFLRLCGASQQGQVGRSRSLQGWHAVEALLEQLAAGQLGHEAGDGQLAIAQQGFSIAEPFGWKRIAIQQLLLGGFHCRLPLAGGGACGQQHLLAQAPPPL